MCGGCGCQLPSPSGRPGDIGGKSPRAACRLASKSRRRTSPGCQATNPIGVFSSPLPLRAPKEMRKEDVPPPRRAGGEREPAGSEELKLRTTVVVDIYPACAHLLTEPATTTSSSHSEHHTAALSFPPGLIPVMPRRHRDVSPCLPCLCAGHRAAELPHRDARELLGHSCP
jgi:hypothetical protein